VWEELFEELGEGTASGSKHVGRATVHLVGGVVSVVGGGVVGGARDGEKDNVRHI
jgi:hypothetical protein